MFLIAVIAALILVFAVTALILTLVARPIVGEWLRYFSAFKAVVAAYATTLIALLFVAYVGDLRLNRILVSDSATVGIFLFEVPLLALGVNAFCRFLDGDRVGMRSALVVAIATLLISAAIGWLALVPTLFWF